MGLSTLSPKTKTAMGALAALVVIGVGTWIYQLINGLGVTGMSNINSWGLYICMFMLFVGLSAGGLIVASSAHVFGIEKFKSVAKPAVICSTVCICMAGMLVLIDLGGIQRVWLLFTSFIHPNVYGGSGITTGTAAAQTDPTAMWMTTGSYAPTVPEVVIFIGVVALGILAFIVLSKIFVTPDER